MIKKPENHPKFEKKISRYILSRFILTLIVFGISILAAFFLVQAFCSLFIWHSDETLYQILKTIAQHQLELQIILFLVGFFIILAYYWNKTLGYLNTVVEATQNMYDKQEALIELPPELKEVENQMNRINMNLRESRRAAKEAEQRKNDLIVYLAHDLKTPLTSIIGYLSLLKEEEQISEKLRYKYLSILSDKAERLEDLINGFFEITRFNLSQLYLEPQKVNLTRMLEQLTFEAKPMLDEKQLTYALEAEPNMHLQCDIDKMQRVLDNLLRNAVNYSFENSSIEISAKRIGNSIKIIFCNQGNTIPKEKLDRIFDQFYRIDASRSTKNGGAGLGLAIAKELVELHGGKISVHSENETIRFELSLPAS